MTRWEIVDKSSRQLPNPYTYPRTEVAIAVLPDVFPLRSPLDEQIEDSAEQWIVVWKKREQYNEQGQRRVVWTADDGTFVSEGQS